MIRAMRNNSASIFLAEIDSAPITEQRELEVGDVFSIDYSTYVKAMNIFYVTGTA